MTITILATYNRARISVKLAMVGDYYDVIGWKDRSYITCRYLALVNIKSEETARRAFDFVVSGLCDTVNV